MFWEHATGLPALSKKILQNDERHVELSNINRRNSIHSQAISAEPHCMECPENNQAETPLHSQIIQLQGALASHD